MSSGKQTGYVFREQPELSELGELIGAGPQWGEGGMLRTGA